MKFRLLCTLRFAVCLRLLRTCSRSNRAARRIEGKKARLPRCSSLIGNNQTALLAPCTRTFLPSTQARLDLEQVLKAHEKSTFEKISQNDCRPKSVISTLRRNY